MGYNTTVVIMNDALGSIEKDPAFGKNLAYAVLQAVHKLNCPVRVGALGHSTAAKVIETHHADVNVLVRIGENTGSVVEHNDFIGVAEMAKRLKMSPDAVRNQIIWRNKLESIKIAGRWVVLREDFDQFVRNLEREI